MAYSLPDSSECAGSQTLQALKARHPTSIVYAKGWNDRFRISGNPRNVN